MKQTNPHGFQSHLFSMNDCNIFPSMIFFQFERERTGGGGGSLSNYRNSSNIQYSYTLGREYRVLR